jgi:hypothetical protein
MHGLADVLQDRFRKVSRLLNVGIIAGILAWHGKRIPRRQTKGSPEKPGCLSTATTNLLTD